ncbi:MAG: hypothetical protein R2822_21140 [Spirosomataceae bacterium]
MMLPVRLYQGNPYWIRPLDKDVEDTFNPEKNKSFKNGEAMRWIAVDDTGQTVGRIAAFINQNTVSKGNDQPTGGMGFFECIEDETVAFALFDTCKNWLSEQGMEAMDGPINFGDRDRFWGLLTEGFDKEPLYGMGYHFVYYQDFFEKYGFEIYFNQLTFFYIWLKTSSWSVSIRCFLTVLSEFCLCLRTNSSILRKNTWLSMPKIFGRFTTKLGPKT